MRKILFRADGSSSTGLGHLYRLFSLVEIVKNTFDFVFITSAETTSSIIPSEYKRNIIPKNISIVEEPQWLFDNYPPENYIIVADGYHFNSKYQLSIKKNGFNLMYIDDLAGEHIFADVVINHSPYLKESNYSKESYTKCFLGTEYALLRPEFLKAAKQSRTIKNVDNVLVCFGGADPLDLTYKTTKEMLNISQIENIHIVLGAAYHHNAIINLQKEHPEKIKLYRNLSEKDLLHVMQHCNFAIAPSSTILYELCCVKMPVYSGYYVDNQKFVYQGFLDASAIIPAGDLSKFNAIDFKENIENILASDNLNDYIKNQTLLFDNKIEARLLNLFNYIALDQLEVRLRTAKKDDLMLFFNWANDKVTRQMSFHKDLISLETHTKWFKNQLSSKDNLLLVMMVKVDEIFRSAGQVKFDSEGVIGIALDKDFRGKNLGTRLITEGLQYAKEHLDHKQIIAYIKKTNKGSVKVFEKAGFLFSDEVLINQEECYKYICNL